MRLLSLLLCSVPVLLAAALLCRVAESRFRPFREPLRRFLRLPRSTQLFLACFVLAFVVYGSTKSGGDTNAPSPQASSPRHAPVVRVEESPAVALTQDQIDAGFALTRVGTNETWDFSAPDGAHVHTPWRLRGASEDRFELRMENEEWRIPFGSHVVDGLVVSSSGVLLPKFVGESVIPADRLAGLFSPTSLPHSSFSILHSSFGLVPEANWGLLPESARPSEAWWHATPSNSVVVTWRNALLGRNAGTTASFQVEVFADGSFVYRYDLSRAGLWNGAPATSVLAGAFNGGKGETLDVAAVTNLTSVFWHALSPGDTPTGDRDGDGLSTAEEIFVHGTAPGLPDTDGDGVPDGEEIARGLNPLSRDTDGDGFVDGSDPDPGSPTPHDDLDGDGIPDAYEAFWFGGTNAFDTTTDRDATGFTLGTKMLAGINPTNAASPATFVSTNSLVSWKLFDGFAADWPAAAATNLVWERTFAVNRSSAWQQFFLSASPSNAAPWCLSGMRLEWETDTGSSGGAASSPFNDSLRIPLAPDDMPASLTLRLRADGPGTVRSPSPVHLLLYAPEIRLEGGRTITGESGAKFTVYLEGSDSAIGLVVDDSRRPHRAPAGADECDMAPFEDFAMQSGGCAFAGDATGGTVAAPRPGIYALPDFALSAASPSPARAPRRSRSAGGGGSLVVLDPSVGWGCAGHGCSSDGLGYDWDDGWYYEEESYPLDSKCLRRKWYRDWGGGWHTGDCELRASSGLGGDDDGPVRAWVDGTVGKVSVDGALVWSGTAEHVYDGSGCGGYVEDVLGDDCDSCDTDCSDGTCAGLEGTTLGSLKFRIPLGAPVKGQVAGFVWFATEGPLDVSRDTFSLLAHPDAHVSDTVSGSIRQIRCTDSHGRDLDIEDISDGVRITIRENASQALEHTWEIVNVGGSNSVVRLRKISRQNNTLSNETYTYADGDWTRFDNVAGVGTSLAVSYGPFEDELVLKEETRTTTDAEGRTLSSVTTRWSRVGECDNAVERETYRGESTGLNDRWSEATYWNDPAHAGRHGMPRLVQGNDRAWVYTDYDDLGHEVLRVEQRGHASVPDDFPYVVSNELYNAASLANAFVTVCDYEPLAGDSCHDDDAAKVRTETRHVVVNGTVTVIGRTWHRYTRLVRDGYAAIRRETWRAGTQNATFGDASNAYSYEIVYADTGATTPLLMRDAVAELLDEDGTLTQNTYSLADGVVSQTSHRSHSSHLFPTYETTETDATYGTLLRRSTFAEYSSIPHSPFLIPHLISDEQSVYDSQNRLRSTTYLDGTSLTNAYSCCRLLWRRDREGRRVLRSAQTGTDHLYYAEEDVWLADISTNGNFRVTQHFFDAIGRETNTVVYVGTTPGEAAVPSQSSHLSHSSHPSQVSQTTTSYPYGGSDCSIHTDERGKVTIRRTDLLGDCIERGEDVFTNDVEVVRTKSRSYFGGGSSTRREWDGDKFTGERRFDDYLADGRRVAYVVTESSDCGVVTNSVTTYDLLGRAVSVATPLSDVVNTYDGTSSRIISSFDAKSDVTTTCLHDACGEQIGTTVNGVTNANVTTYEEISNAWWKVVTDSVVGTSTNSWSITRTRLTGLSDSCRSEVVVERSQGATDRTRVCYDSATGVQTETVDSSLTGTRAVESLYGIEFASTDVSGATTNRHDALGRRIRVDKGSVVREYAYDAADALVEARTLTETNVLVEAYVLDTFGRRVETVDALGQSTYTVYDPLGNVTAEWGATYPVQYEYDTAGRRTALGMTLDGVAWNWTRWEFDPATGLCLRKTYADGSFESYSYTADGLLERTTHPGGTWLANEYDVNRRLACTVSSDGALDAAYGRDEYGRIVAASNAVAQTDYVLCESGSATNESWRIGTNAFEIVRSFDGQGRLRSLAVGGTGYSQFFDYTPDNLISSVSNDDAIVTYAYADDRGETGYTLELANGLTFTRTVTRDPHRPGLVTSVTNCCGSAVRGLAYTHDDLSRPVSRNVDTFGYNERGEVEEALIEGNTESHAYDLSGNSTFAAFNAATNFYTANNLNQYVSVSGESIATPVYTADGGSASYGPWAYAYDSASRLVSVSSNGVLLVTNAYDSRGRRVRKVTPSAVTTFAYDDWNLVRETVMYTTSVSDAFEYFWGRDLSGSFQGAGGVGGLLYVKLNGVVYIPFMDANGNITAYVDSIGTVVAEYVYDCFGRTISQSGPLADVFHHRFSSKYFDVETELYYYGYRFYSSQLRRWLNRDPIAENGGLNLYCLCNNNVLRAVDPLGRDRYMTTFSLDPRKDQWHVGVAVDTWKCSNGQWIKTGVATFDFGIDDSSFWNRLGTYFVTVGAITESEGNTLVEPMAFFSTPKQDIEMLKKIRSELTDPSLYSFFFNNCIHWANKVIDYGMDK